jgi:hypothetical protein
MKFEVWAGEGDGAVSRFLIVATDEKRAELMRADPDAMQNLIATFEAPTWEEAKAKFDEDYESSSD